MLRNTPDNKLLNRELSAAVIHEAITIPVTATTKPTISLSRFFPETESRKINRKKKTNAAYTPDSEKSRQKKTEISLPVINPAPITLPIIVNTEPNKFKKVLFIF